MDHGRIVLLNGYSSAGKTTLAACIQRLAPDLQLLHVQLDAFRAMEPADYFSPKHRNKWPERIAALCHTMNNTALQFAAHGQNVIVDHVLSVTAWRYVLEDLRDKDVLLVKVVCSLEDAERRESTRPDRTPGLARSQQSLHDGRLYDFAVDTSVQTPDQAAQSLLEWLRQRPRPEALAAMATAARTD